MEFFDFTYDGSVKDGLLSGGLGQLVDYEVGEANFRLDGQNLGRKGYEWVGWRNDSTGSTASKPVEIVFRFDQVDLLTLGIINLIFIHLLVSKIDSTSKTIKTENKIDKSTIKTCGKYD